ncbi:MAG: zinc ribbon domain-containing protein [Pyrinomonadaceae bacterium]
MHCPRCGQQQVSDNVKFCSRCGFLLELIPEILANGGILPQLAELNKNKKWLTRKNVIKTGLVWMIFMWLVVAPLGGISNVDEITALGGILGFAGIVLSFVIAFLFLNKESKFTNSHVSFRTDAMPQNLSGNASQNALPPQQSVPISSYTPPPPANANRCDTGDFLSPLPSVTDPTTKLLKKEE